MSSYTLTESTTFSITHARHMAAKIATDLKRIQRLYGSPSDKVIADYEAEAVAMIKAGYVSAVTYGFNRNGSWIEPSLVYTSRDLAGGDANDDDPGRIRPGKDIAGATFTSSMTCTAAYHNLTENERKSFLSGLPVQRVNAAEPTVAGYLSRDLTYSAGGRALDRSTVRSY